LIRYIIRRLLWVIVLLFLVSFITFVIFYLLPTADPASLRAGRQPNPELVEQIRHNLGLDNPWYQQYYDYMNRLVLHFDFGYSFQNNISVKQQISDRLPASVSVAVGAAVIFLISGVTVGIISAIRRRTLLDPTAMALTLIAITAPVYRLGQVAL
jgi:peptide/nickel transport system permease protein